MAIIKTQVDNALLIHHDDYSRSGPNAATIAAHYEFYFNLLQKIVRELKLNISINLGTYEESADSIFGRRKYIPADLILGFQYEQLIYEEEPNKFILSPSQEDRVNNILSKADIILDFSASNIKFASMLDIWYKTKAVYVPALYKCDINNSSRTNNIISISTLTERRYDFTKRWDDHYADQLKIDWCTAETVQEAKTLLDKYKIYLEVANHKQFKTFSELRHNPFVCTGILIVADNMSAFREDIPYYKHIVWGDYDKLPDIVGDVLHNYEDYRIQYLSGLEATIQQMEQLAYTNLKNAILNFLDSKRYV